MVLSSYDRVGDGGPKTAYVNRYGDPLDFKSSTWVSLLRPIAGRPNFTLRRTGMW